MTGALRSLVREVIDPVLYRLDPHYAFHHARRDWNRRAQVVPRETTATFDAANREQYWASGYRDRDLLLGVGHWTVFGHMPKTVLARYLNESHRVLRPDGCLVFEAQVRETGTNTEPAPHEREYSRAELAAYCSGHGFRWSAERTMTSVPGTLTLTMAWTRGQP